MRHLLLIILFPFVMNGNSLSPADSTLAKRPRFIGLYGSGGVFITPSVFMNRGELGRLSPEFNSPPYTTYNESSYAKSGYTGNSSFALGLSFFNSRTTDSLKGRWQTNVAVTYLTDQSAIASFEHYSSERKDTLVSVSGGSTYYKDQVYYNLVYATYSSNYLGLDVSETFTSNLKKFFSFTGGFGLSGMAAIDPHLHENSGVWTGENITSDPYHNYDSTKVDISGYKFTSTDRAIATDRRAMIYTVYASVGFNVRWMNSKKKLRLILNPMLKAGVRMFDLDGAVQSNHAYFQPCINLKFVLN
ncbi:MAG: hypothetical protein ACXVP0_07460 [Bacteroidia bacterium]